MDLEVGSKAVGPKIPPMAGQEGVCHSLDDELDDAMDSLSSVSTDVSFANEKVFFLAIVCADVHGIIFCVNMTPFTQEPPLDEFDMWHHQQETGSDMTFCPEKRSPAQCLFEYIIYQYIIVYIYLPEDGTPSIGQ